jgi:hypothetical protein
VVKKSLLIINETIMLDNLNWKLILTVTAVLVVLYYVLGNNQQNTNQVIHENMASVQGEEPLQVYDLGMYDFPNTNAFGTTEGPERLNNASVRPEFSSNPFPIAEGCTGCPAKGCPNPADGNLHVCKCGLPSKRMIDAFGGSHFSLPHMCAPCGGNVEEPSNLGRWWKRKGCSNPESVGLDLRPGCSRCGN